MIEANYTFKCNARRKKFIKISGIMVVGTNFTHKKIYMNYHHLTIEECCCIREFYKNGKFFREIAVAAVRIVLLSSLI